MAATSDLLHSLTCCWKQGYQKHQLNDIHAQCALHTMVTETPAHRAYLFSVARLCLMCLNLPFCVHGVNELSAARNGPVGIIHFYAGGCSQTAILLRKLCHFSQPAFVNTTRSARMRTLQISPYAWLHILSLHSLHCPMPKCIQQINVKHQSARPTGWPDKSFRH